jgi:hypothetical protein
MDEADLAAAAHELAIALRNDDRRSSAEILQRVPADKRDRVRGHAETIGRFVDRLRHEHPVLPTDDAERDNIVKQVAASERLTVEDAKEALRQLGK